jgi:YD repeat-containing protein
VTRSVLAGICVIWLATIAMFAVCSAMQVSRRTLAARSATRSGVGPYAPATPQPLVPQWRFSPKGNQKVGRAAAGRLSTLTTAGGMTTYTYDANGNRLSASDPSGMFNG